MRLRNYSSLLAIVLALATCSAGFAQQEPADRLTSPIVASQRTVTNLVHPLATAKNDLGRVNGSQVFHRMILILQRSPEQEAALQQLLKDQQDPQSPQYHKWLTPTQFGQQFGPSDNDMARIQGWLTSQGFSVEKPSNGRQFIFFTGTSAQVETAFQTQMHQFGVGGKTYISNATPASIPTALSPAVRGVASLTSFGNFKPQSYPSAQPKILIGQYIYTGPADLATIYDAAPLQKSGINGQGESIALIEESNINLQDLTDFRTVTGLPPATVNVLVNGPDPGPLASDGEEFEAISDVEYAGSLAPDATLNVIVSASTEFNQGIDLSTVYAVDYDVSPITSLSYGGCETLNDTFYGGTVNLYAYAYEQGAAEGISHFVSAGDNGGDSCEYTGLSAGYGVNAIGDSPWNVSVGGTEFIMPDPYQYFPPPNYNATGYIPESTWNDYENPYDGRPLAGTGGVSINWSKPAWQAGPGVPADGQRDVPDVSLLSADNLAYLTCERDIGYNCAQGYGGGVIGTSLSSPTWASIQALVDQKNNLLGGAGNPNPVYYKLAAGSSSPFHDITVGDTKVPDPDGLLVGYNATAGYDLATGLGSVDVNKLATAWAPATGSGAATVTISTGGVTSITHGDKVTVGVNATSTGSTIPSGDVVIMAGTQGLYQLTLDNTGNASINFGDLTYATDSQAELPGGSYSLTARYAGDANFAPATSNAIALTVNPEPTVTFSAASGPTTVPYGTPVTVIAASYGVNSGTGFPVPGTYTFTDGSTTVGTAKLADTGEGFAYATLNNSASLTITGAQSLAVGSHSINVASPPAGASFLASATTTPVTVTVTPGAVLVSLTPDRTNPAVNSTVNLLGTVLNGYGNNVPLSGSIDFYDYTANVDLGSVALPALPNASGVFAVTKSVSFSTAGLHTVVAIYSGDANDSGNISGAVNLNVGGAGAKAASTTTIAPGAGLVVGTYALAQNNISIKATVAGDTNGTSPSGTVTFIDTYNKNATVGTATVTNGTATLTTKTLAAGLHFITANYGGDSNFAASASQSIEVIIGDFTFSAGSSPSATVTAGQSSSSITLTYTGSSDFTQFPGGAALGGVVLSCSGLPTGATCNFSTPVLVPTDTSNGTTTGSATVYISTTAPTLQKAANDAPRKPWSSTGGLALAGLLALGLPFAFRRKKYFGALLGLVLLAVVGTLNGCGYNGPQRYSIVSGTGTPAGSSTVTVTATLEGGAIYGVNTHTATINLTVNAQQ